MGQIKNIKLHIVTDIKSRQYLEKEIVEERNIVMLLYQENGITELIRLFNIHIFRRMSKRSIRILLAVMVTTTYVLAFRYFDFFQLQSTTYYDGPAPCIAMSPHRKHFINNETLSATPYGNGTCAVCHSQTRLREILQRWVEMARHHNITYMLTYGSLLGAHRNGDVIPWDTDIDVYIES